METKRNTKLITKVFVIGVFIAVLSYLFHPDIGQLSIMVNGEPIADPLIRIAAIPTFLIILGLAIFLTMLLFMGIGIFFFFGALFFTFMGCLMMAPYFWPVLVIVFLSIILMSVGDEKPDAT
jgi:hypothetical protein